MKRTLIALLLSAVESPAMAQISDKMAEGAYIYGYSMDEAYKFFYETAVKKNVPLNRFQNIRHLADDTYTDHPTINESKSPAIARVIVRNEKIGRTVAH